MSGKMADVRAIALLSLARSFYGASRNLGSALENKRALQGERRIYKDFLAKYGDALSDDMRRQIEHRIEYLENEIKIAEELIENYRKDFVEVNKELEKVLGW